MTSADRHDPASGTSSPHSLPSPQAVPFPNTATGTPPSPGGPAATWGYRPTATGSVSYALGFLAYVPIPILNAVIAGVAMALSYRTQQLKSPLAAENSRRAANWGLTYITIVVTGLALTLLGVGIVVSTTPDGARQSGWPVVFFVVAYLGGGLMHLVTIAIGMSRAGRGLVTAPIAISFIRPAAPDPAPAGNGSIHDHAM